MDQHGKSELIKSYRKRYRRAQKRDKTRIVDVIVDVTGYNRKHVIRALNQDVQIPRKIIRKRISPYARVYKPLRSLWAASNFLCGKRLAPFLPELLRSMKKHREITISEEDSRLLLNMSAATIDRLLTRDRREMSVKGRSTTKPGTLLKHQIPIRTFADWDNASPGFLEVDLVAHCGDSMGGEYANTLTMTDVATGWTVCAAFMGRGERFCVAAIEEARAFFPFPVVGIDSDNDSVFINAHFMKYCEANSLTFTRGRPWKKNDSCHVEQKNWDIVRKMIGYGRFETYTQLGIIKEIHVLLALYQNYFQPSRKLVSKTRRGATVTRRYDTAQTPAQRLLARGGVDQKVEKNLSATFNNLNPVQLLRAINRLVSKLYEG